MSAGRMEKAADIIDSEGVTLHSSNFLVSESSDIQSLSSYPRNQSDAAGELNSSTVLLRSDASSMAYSTNGLNLVENSVSDFETEKNGRLDAEVEASTGDTNVNASAPGMASPHKPNCVSPNATMVNETNGYGNQVTTGTFSAEVVDEIVIELDRPLRAVTSSYREHLPRWPSSSDIGDESSSSSDESCCSDVSSSSTSSSSSSENEKGIQVEERPKMLTLKPKLQSLLPKTKGELTIYDLPPIEDMNISLPDEEPLEKIGIVFNLVDQLVIVQALKDTRPLDIDSVLFLEGRKPLGQVFDVLGPVLQPFYAVRFNSAEDISNKQIVQGLPVFCAPGRSEVTTYIFTEELRKQKGSDASWKDNNEPPIQFIDYSDDEEERKAKQKRKAKSLESSEKDVEIVHESKLPHTSICSSGSGRAQWRQCRNVSSVPLRPVHFGRPLRMPTVCHNQFMRFQAPPPPVFGHPPSFSRGPPGFGYGNNAWPPCPENMMSVDRWPPVGFHFQGSLGQPPNFRARPPFFHNGHQNPCGVSPYSMLPPPQDLSYFSYPQQRFAPPQPLQNSTFSPDLQQNSSFSHSQDWFRPPQCTVPAGLFLPPPPPPP